MTWELLKLPVPGPHLRGSGLISFGMETGHPYCFCSPGDSNVLQCSEGRSRKLLDSEEKRVCGSRGGEKWRTRCISKVESIGLANDLDWVVREASRMTMNRGTWLALDPRVGSLNPVGGRSYFKNKVKKKKDFQKNDPLSY